MTVATTAKQLDDALQSIEANRTQKRLAYEDIIWGLINTKEFILIQ